MVASKSILLAVKTVLASRGKRNCWRAVSPLAFFIPIGLAVAPGLKAQTLTVLHNFGAGDDGVDPQGALILSGNTLYGTASGGGVTGSGTVFKVNTDGTGYTTLYNFTATSPFTNGDGASPSAGLVLSGNTLYGTTPTAGGLGDGTVFALDTNGANFTVLHTFTDGDDGASPMGGLLLSGNTLYGTTSSIATSNFAIGTVFAVNTDGTAFSTLHSFSSSDGGALSSGLILSGNTLYGTALIGGASDDGTVFKVNTDGTSFTVLHNFTGGSNGFDPVGGLVLSGNALYGTTDDAIGMGYGTIFVINTNGEGFANLYNFAGESDGANPLAGLILSSDTLYGTTQGGGNSNAGKVFQINTDGTGFADLYSFNSSNNYAGDPEAGLLLSGNTLYGTTYSGGSLSEGTVFSLTLATVGASQGSLQVIIEPSGAVSNGAQWQVDGGTLQDSGAIVSNLSVGNHTVSFNTISNWTTPANQTASVTTNSTATANGTYTAIGSGLTGALIVTLQPVGAVSAGAQWNLDYGPGQDSGVTITNLSTGNHTLSFTTVSGWGTPADQNVAITGGATNTATGFYTATGNGLTGALSVTLLPAGAVAAGAQWQVDGGTVQDSGAIATNLSVGSHVLSFTFVPGWDPPADQTITITNEATTTANGLYTALITPIDGLILKTNGYGTIQHGAWPEVLEIGKKYTVTAVPDQGSLFSNWVGGTRLPYAVLSSSASYTFTMQSNLTLEANFTSNMFLAAQGAYIGLFGPPYAARQQTESGSFSIYISDRGTVSGALSLGGHAVPLSGKFGLDGAVSITSKTIYDEFLLTTTIQLDVTNQSVSGTVSDGFFYATLNGNREVFSRTNTATGFEGQYTWVIPGTNLPTVGPFGTSYGTAKVDAMGHITLTGSLADGTAISQSSVVSKDGNWPLYVNLYGRKGSLWGWVNFTNQTLTASPSISWINTTNSARAALYRSGFADQSATLTGGPYLPGQALPAGLAVTLQGGNLPSTITVTNLAENTNKLVLKTNQKTGVISGSFANPDDPKQIVRVNGVILQRQTNAEGYFLGTSQSGAFTLGPP
jgi:uncharacterized repeat protein (TIGR03803 family)